MEAITSNVSALQPDLDQIAKYHSTLVNGGIITPNEARKELRYDPKPDSDTLRIPANIAGSAADPSQGGRPKQ
ncbi:MAG: phage portal protein, partial [Betaproteobacteria bacterium]|nr:phage portal protein [Betaproteobacteria bacterium]